MSELNCSLFLQCVFILICSCFIFFIHSFFELAGSAVDIGIAFQAMFYVSLSLCSDSGLKPS